MNCWYIEHISKVNVMKILESQWNYSNDMLICRKIFWVQSEIFYLFCKNGLQRAWRWNQILFWIQKVSRWLNYCLALDSYQTKALLELTCLIKIGHSKNFRYLSKYTMVNWTSVPTYLKMCRWIDYVWNIEFVEVLKTCHRRFIVTQFVKRRYTYIMPVYESRFHTINWSLSFNNLASFKKNFDWHSNWLLQSSAKFIWSYVIE